jgi:hypothetical protein
MWVSLIASVVLSTAMTAAGVQEAPTFFFWESFVGAYRLKLLQGRVGHSTSLWLTALLFAWYCAALTRQLLGERPTGKRRSACRIVCWLAILAALLFATKTRLSLMIMGTVVLSCGAAFAVRSLRVGVIVCVLLSGIYMISITTLLLAPSLQAPVDEVSTQVQSYMPWLRIEGIRRSTSDAGASNDALFTGRTILTQALLQLALDHPLTGVGRENPIIDPGVDESGRAPILRRQTVAQSESPLRNAAKFGFVFFAVVLMQVFATLYLLLVNRTVRARACAVRRRRHDHRDDRRRARNPVRAWRPVLLSAVLHAGVGAQWPSSRSADRLERKEHSNMNILLVGNYAVDRQQSIKIVDVARSPEWNESLYREDTHPTA